MFSIVFSLLLIAINLITDGLLLDLFHSEAKIEIQKIKSDNNSLGQDICTKLLDIPEIFKIESSGWFDLKGDGEKKEFYAIYYANKNKLLKHIVIISTRDNRILYADSILYYSQYHIEYFVTTNKPQLLIATLDNIKTEPDIINSRLSLVVYEFNSKNEFQCVFFDGPLQEGKLVINNNSIEIHQNNNSYRIGFNRKYRKYEL